MTSSAAPKTSDVEQLSEEKKLTSLIAWLSVCLLTAGWGPQIDPFYRQIWSIFGLFGLTAAVGLEVLERARRHKNQRHQNRRIRRRLERELTRIASGNVNVMEIRNVLQRLACDDLQSQSSHSNEQAEPRLSFHRPIRVTPLTPRAADVDDSPVAEMTGWIRDISPNGVGLEHNQPLPRGPVKLTIDFDKGESVSLMADLSWCERQTNGTYFSGGRLCQVASPAESSAPLAVPVG